ncbi:hypothetical protein AVEN_84961-1 [Araneus ventricosus]|uniref:Uncharacterized protein n=1 Tax=Araneus ventricosus TaxID=182803 RepID=A0A4Y2BYE8_ARAVE|nr:hypothetical protein AVEN_84961-1 [Araneus ventricosus]
MNTCDAVRPRRPIEVSTQKIGNVHDVVIDDSIVRVLGISMIVDVSNNCLHNTFREHDTSENSPQNRCRDCSLWIEIKEVLSEKCEALSTQSKEFFAPFYNSR